MELVGRVYITYVVNNNIILYAVEVFKIHFLGHSRIDVLKLERQRILILHRFMYTRKAVKTLQKSHPNFKVENLKPPETKLL